ncbi:MAG: hypothetical protein AB2A00_41285, partial [Myxococcota bacterium]
MSERLGELLIQIGALRPEDLNRALRLKREKGGRLGEILLAAGLIDEDTLLKALARQRRVPFAEARWFEAIESRVIRLVPRQKAAQHRVVPLRLMDKKLVLATCVADNLDRLTELGESLGYALKPVLARRADIDRALGRYYRMDPAQDFLGPITGEVQLLVKKKDPSGPNDALNRPVPQNSVRGRPLVPPGPAPVAQPTPVVPTSVSGVYRPSPSGSYRPAMPLPPMTPDPSLPFQTMVSPRPMAPPAPPAEPLVSAGSDAELRELFASEDDPELSPPGFDEAEPQTSVQAPVFEDSRTAETPVARAAPP